MGDFRRMFYPLGIVLPSLNSFLRDLISNTLTGLTPYATTPSKQTI